MGLWLLAEAKHRATALLPRLKSELDHTPQNLDLRIRLAHMLVLLDRREESLALLDAGIVFTSDAAVSKRLSNVKAEVLVAQAQKLAAKDSSLPDHPYLRETRGHIYLRMGRFSEAIADLERALSAPELLTTVRNRLAEAYSFIGQFELADEHRRLILMGE